MSAKLFGFCQSRDRLPICYFTLPRAREKSAGGVPIETLSTSGKIHNHSQNKNSEPKMKLLGACRCVSYFACLFIL